MNTDRQIATLVQAVTGLQEAVSQLMESSIQVESITRRETATSMAAHSMIAEIAMHLGVPPDRVGESYRQRVSHYLDQIVSSSGDQDSALSAQLDARTPDEVPAEPGFLLLFPDTVE